MRIDNSTTGEISTSVDKAQNKAVIRKSSDTLHSQDGLGKKNNAEHSSVEISEGARAMRQARDIAQNAPDINLAKVEALRARIEQGTYQVDADQLADKILEDHMSIHFGKNQL